MSFLGSLTMFNQHSEPICHQNLHKKSRKCWIEETFYKRECVKFIPACRDVHRCYPVCQVCQNIIRPCHSERKRNVNTRQSWRGEEGQPRCCCGRLLGEHTWLDAGPPLSLFLGPGQEESWSVQRHTRTSNTDAYGTIEFQDSVKRACRAKYIRVAVDTKAEALLQLMLREWQMAKPKLVLSIHGGTDNFSLPPRVKLAFSRGLVRAAQSTGAWILTDGINTGVSRYVGEALKAHSSLDLHRRNTLGVTQWGVVENHWELIGPDLLKPYQPLMENPLSKRVFLNGLHSHFLLVDDGTLGKNGCQQEFRRRLEKHIQTLKIHPRLKQGVPMVCVVVEGGPGIFPTVLDYVSSVPPVPIFVFEGSGGAADLLAFLYKQTDLDRQLDADIQEDLLLRIEGVFGLERDEVTQLSGILMECMKHRQSITIFDSESEEQQEADAAILTTTLKGTMASPASQLNMTLAWDRADIASTHVLVYGQQWQVGSLEQTMLNALLMDRVDFVKLLIDRGMTMNHFLSVERLEQLYNTPKGVTDDFLHHLVEDARQTHLPVGYKLSIIDVGMVIEYLIGGAYRSSYTRKLFRAAYHQRHAQGKEPDQDGTAPQTRGRRPGASTPQPGPGPGPQHPSHFFRTAQPYKCKDFSGEPNETTAASQPHDNSRLFVYNFNDLFVWAVLQRRQQMALFLWQHGEEALARATVACKLYRSMALEARQSYMADSIAEEFKTYSLEFGQLAVDLLDCAFRQDAHMAMKLLTSEMEGWSCYTCLQMAVSCHLHAFVSHSCTQTLLTDLWTGRLNMRKNSYFKIILSLLLPPAILLLEFKSSAQMSHVPQSQEAMQFGWDSAKPITTKETGEKDVADAEKGNPSDPVPASYRVSSHWLCWARKFYEFYAAPVVKFWFHTMSYLVFLLLFAYTVLVKLEDQPSVPEWLVIIYILSTALEKTREVMMSEPRQLTRKLRVWLGEFWNVLDLLAILLFLSGLVLRCYTGQLRTAGRISYCLDIIFWSVRVLDLLALNQYAGPYLTMITKMTKDMFYIVVMMAIVLLSFGVSRKAILSPDEEPSWRLAQDVVDQPYWMMFGEVYAGEIDACEGGQPCPPGSFITPFLQAVYLFVQYIIMVNLLIAVFNNVYFNMKSITNKVWKYNRYRYIMTYQERAWLPPPFILLSHLSQCVSAVYCKHRGFPGQEGHSGLKLYLGWEDLKKLHEFEESCVEIHIHEKKHILLDSQANRIKATTERAEEMVEVVLEVSEKVHFIQDNLQVLDQQLGQLQNMSVLAVDTLSLFSASSSRQQEEERLAHCQTVARPRHLSHSWTLSRGAGGDVPKPYLSTPPSLLRAVGPRSHRLSLEWHISDFGGRPRGSGHTERGEAEEAESFQDLRSPTGPPQSELWHLGYTPLGSLSQLAEGWRDQAPCGSRLPSPSGSLPDVWLGEGGLVPLTRPWACNVPGSPHPEEEERGGMEVSSADVSQVSSQAVLLPAHKDDRGGCGGGLVNPAFCSDQSEISQSGTSRLSRHSQWGRTKKCPRWVCRGRDRSYDHCRSLSASVENMTLSGAPLSPLQASFPALNGPMNSLYGRRSLDTPFGLSKSIEWSQSSDMCGAPSSRLQKKIHPQKIQEDDYNAVDMLEPLSPTSWRKNRRRRGQTPCWSASTSLSQLNLEPMDFLHKLSSPLQNSSHSVWNSWTKTPSRRSSLQSWMGPDVKTFQSSEPLGPQYSAMERNNLMRLAHTIPFTPVSFQAGEEVSVYSLEEVRTEVGSVFSWSSQGLTAVLQPLSGDSSLACDGSLVGGLRWTRRVLCTWAEKQVLRPGQVYMLKTFRPEVDRTWQEHFSTNLQLCLREIQHQRAAQKLMQVFNQVNPDKSHSPRFLDVLLVHSHSDGQWLTIERNLAGEFRKYNSTGQEIAPCCSLEETLLAFSHWTYQYSAGEMLVLDIQGVGEELTEPSIICAKDQSSCSSADTVFGPAHLGDDVISSFLLRHNCNTCCQRLGLTDLRRRSKDDGWRMLRASEQEEEEDVEEEEDREVGEEVDDTEEEDEDEEE